MSIAARRGKSGGEPKSDEGGSPRRKAFVAACECAKRRGVRQPSGALLVRSSTPRFIQTMAGNLCAVQHARDFNPILHRPVKDDVTANRKATEARRQFLAPPSELRHCRQLGKSRDDGMDKFVRRVHVVLRDVEPDFIQVRARRTGNPILFHVPRFFSRSRPARPTSSASCITFASL